MVTVHTKPSCVQCNATYRKLDEVGVTYEVIDLSLPENEELLLSFKDRGLLQAPIVTTGTDEWTGFRPDKIEELVAA